MAIADDPQNPFVPDLASTYEVNRDATELTFRLRPGIRFSDGSPLTAADFKWSWERALGLGGTEVVNTLGRISGADAILMGNSTELTGVNPVDDATLVVRLDEPDVDFPGRVASRSAFVLKRTNVEGWTINPFEGAKYSYLRAGANTLPVGAGPFAIVDVHTDGTYQLEPNPHYHGATPHIARLLLTDPDDFIDPLIHFESGALDLYHLASVYPGFPEEYILPDNLDGRIVYSNARSELDFIVINDAKPPLDDLEFRRALVAAVDHFDSLSYPAIDARMVRTDENDIAAILDASNYASNDEYLNLTFHTDRGYTFEREVESVASSWQAHLGASSRFVQLDPSDFADAAANGDIGIVLERAVYQYPSDASIVDQIIQHLARIAQGREAAAIIQLHAQARASVDPVERQRKYQTVADALLQAALVIPVEWTPQLDASYLRHGIEGYDAPRFGGSRFAGVRVAR